MGTLFNNPTSSDPAQQNAIRNQVRALIAAADTGSTIRMALYHFWDNTIAQDLASAHTARGVNVRVVLDSTTLDYPSAYNTLKSALGTDTRLGSYVMLCRTGTSCLGSTREGHQPQQVPPLQQPRRRRGPAGGVPDHLQPHPVELLPLLEQRGERRRQHRAVHGVHLLLRRAGPAGPGELEYTYANAGAYRCTSSPRGQHHRHRHRRQRARQRQVHLERRQRHPPHRHPGRDAEDHPPSGRGQAALLAAAGCTVDIVYSETDTGTWNALHGQPRLTTRCYQHDDDANPATPNRIVHSKNMMIDGMYAGARHKLVFTGSHNWSGPALRDNDEAMLRITTPSVYDAFTANLTRVRAAALPGVSDNVAACR